MMIKTTITLTLTKILSKKEFSEEFLVKNANEFKKFVLDNKEKIEDDIINFYKITQASIDAIKVEELEEEEE